MLILLFCKTVTVFEVIKMYILYILYFKFHDISVIFGEICEMQKFPNKNVGSAVKKNGNTQVVLLCFFFFTILHRKMQGREFSGTIRTSGSDSIILKGFVRNADGKGTTKVQGKEV